MGGRPLIDGMGLYLRQDAFVVYLSPPAAPRQR
jgi:hypothetical protein